MLFARRPLDGRDKLADDAHFRKGAENGVMIRRIVADGLIKADHPLLHEILPVRADEKIWPRFDANDILVTLAKRFVRAGIPGVGTLHERFIRHVEIIEFFGHVASLLFD